MPIFFLFLTIICVLPVLIWQVVVAIAGLLPMKKRLQIADKQHRFAIVVSARHEANVIGNLLDSLKEQQYPRELFDLFVIADNCTDDDTAGVARAHGAKVYERFNTERVGKGYALQWGFSQIRTEYPGKYDAYCIFDADNLATPTFLQEMNRTLCTGADVAQGYRETKNTSDTWVSGCYAIYWHMFMRFFNQARNNMGLSCLVSGTGFVFRAELLEPNGWTACTMTEDMEFSIQQIMAGHTIAFAPGAVFYDEQPTKFWVSIRQRHRWSVGCVQVVQTCWDRTKAAMKARSRSAWDMFLYQMLTPVAAVMVVFGAITTVLMVLQARNPLDMLIPLAISTALSYVASAAFGLIIVILAKKSVKKLWFSILMYPIFLVPLALLALVAVIHPRTVWRPIAHQSKNTIGDMMK